MLSLINKCLPKLAFDNNKYQVGAALLHRGRVVKLKPNRYKTHPLSKFFGQEYAYLHAETNCIISHGLDNCEGLDLLVFRVTPSQKRLTMAKPCDACMAMIEEANIANIYYTNWTGEIERCHCRR